MKWPTSLRKPIPCGSISRQTEALSPGATHTAQALLVSPSLLWIASSLSALVLTKVNSSSNSSRRLHHEVQSFLFSPAPVALVRDSTISRCNQHAHTRRKRDLPMMILSFVGTCLLSTTHARIYEMRSHQLLRNQK